MKRIYDGVKSRHANAGRLLRVVNPAPRWRMVFMSLGLMLVLVIAGGLLPAQAAPAGATKIDTWLYARKIKGNQTICVGDKVVIAVEVWKKVEGVGEEGNMLGRLIGVEVQASVVDPSIGSINPPKKMTNMNGTPPGSVYFTFDAKNPGTTPIQFWGKVSNMVYLGLEISSNSVTTEISVKVEECEYKVNTYSRWVQQGGAFTLIARINGAGMTMDKPGHYKGDAVVQWDLIPTIELAGCTIGVLVIPPSWARLTGGAPTPDDPDFILDVDFDPVAFEPVEISCPTPLGSPEGIVSPAFKVKPEPLTKRFPASGGARDVPHPLTRFPSGTTNIVLMRVTDQ